MNLRVTDHPILGRGNLHKTVHIIFEGRLIEAIEDEPIAAALLAAGISVFRYTEKLNKPRSVFCAIGRCSDCAMIVDGKPYVRACVTKVRDGMVVERQHGAGR